MSRETKFRGLDLKTNEWIYGDLCDYMRGSGKCIMPDAFFATRDYDEGVIEDTMAIGGFVPVKPESVGEYTGLKDKNGKELYSDDLFEDEKGRKYRCYNVVGGFAHSLPAFPSTYKGTAPYPLQPLADEQTVSWFESNCTIFGNLYENPELL